MAEVRQTACGAVSAGNASHCFKYTWDAENRLIAVEPGAASPLNGSQKAEYNYDYQGRRIQKQVWSRAGGGWGTPVVRRFIWDGWKMLLELDGSDNAVRKYTWGLDLAGQAGGQGGEQTSGLSAGLEGAGAAGPRHAHPPAPG